MTDLKITDIYIDHNDATFFLNEVEVEVTYYSHSNVTNEENVAGTECEFNVGDIVSEDTLPENTKAILENDCCFAAMVAAEYDSCLNSAW